MNIQQMVRQWIEANGIGAVDQYDIDKAAAMVQKWANEDTDGVVAALPAEDVASIIESHRIG
jgi:hypothetical protein